MANTCTILIADTSEALRETLREILQDSYQLWFCRDGRTALEMLHRYRPDVLVLDLMLPGFDGLSLLQTAADAGLHPAVLATTRMQNDYILDTAYRLGVSYIMLRPCKISAMVDRIQDLASRCRQDQAAEDIRIQVRRILVRLGFSTAAKRYALVEDAVVWMADNPGAFLSKELYPGVGKPYGMAQTAVEKRIRDLIHGALQKGDPQIWALYFPADADGNIRCPSNGEFLARIAQCLPTALERGAMTNV